MTDYGIEVAEKDVDVQEAASYELILKSGQTLLKEFARGKVTMDSDPEVVSHGLGYVPQFLAWATYPDYPDFEGLNTILLMTGNFDAGAAYSTTSSLNLAPSSAQGNDNDAKYYIFYDPADSTTPTDVFDGDDYGLQASVDGVDVQEASILEKTFDSKKNTMKYLESTITSSGATDTNITVEHDLNVIPGYLLYFKVGSGKWYSTWEKEDVSGANVQVGATSEDSNVYVQIKRTGSCVVTIKLMVFVDPGN